MLGGLSRTCRASSSRSPPARPRPARARRCCPWRGADRRRVRAVSWPRRATLTSASTCTTRASSKSGGTTSFALVAVDTSPAAQFLFVQRLADGHVRRHAPRCVVVRTRGHAPRPCMHLPTRTTPERPSSSRFRRFAAGAYFFGVSPGQVLLAVVSCWPSSIPVGHLFPPGQFVDYDEGLPTSEAASGAALLPTPSSLVV